MLLQEFLPLSCCTSEKRFLLFTPLKIMDRLKIIQVSLDNFVISLYIEAINAGI